jgi:hypothetical protein
MGFLGTGGAARPALPVDDVTEAKLAGRPETRLWL